MPYKPQHGGTNGVPELDLGQEGSPRAAANTASYNPKVTAGKPNIGKVKNPLMQQNKTLLDHTGFKGRPFQWKANLRVAGDDVLAGIESELHAAMSGFALIDGVMEPFDGAKIKATKLTNKTGRTLSEKAILDDYRFGDQLTITTPGSPFTILVPLTIVFQGLG